MRKLFLLLAVLCFSCPDPALAYPPPCAFAAPTYTNGSNTTGPWMRVVSQCAGQNSNTCKYKVVYWRSEWDYDLGVYVPTYSNSIEGTIYCGDWANVYFFCDWNMFTSNWPCSMNQNFYAWNGTSYVYVSGSAKYFVSP